MFEEVLIKHVEEHEPLADGDADVFLEEVLVKHVEEHEPLVDSHEDVLLEDESLSDIPEHLFIDQRTGPSTTQHGTYSINQATMVDSSIQPDLYASDKKKRPLYSNPVQGENDSVLA